MVPFPLSCHSHPWSIRQATKRILSPNHSEVGRIQERSDTPPAARGSFDVMNVICVQHTRRPESSGPGTEESSGTATRFNIKAQGPEAHLASLSPQAIPQWVSHPWLSVRQLFFNKVKVNFGF